MNIQQVMIPDHDVATARVPGPARVGSGPGLPGQGQLTSHLQRVCNLLGCRGKQLRGIYTSSGCKKAVLLNISHLMSDDSDAPLSPDQPPHSPPEKLSTNSMLVTVDGHSEAVSSNLNLNGLDVVIQPDHDHDCRQWATGRGPGPGAAHWQVSILV